MRLFLTLTLALFSPSAVCLSQRIETDPIAEAAETNPKVYVVQVTEFRLKSASDTKMKADEIVAKFTAGDEEVEVVQAVRLSTLASFESFAQFGSIKSVTTGFSGSDRRAGGGPLSPPVRRTEDRPVGTLVKVKLSPAGEFVFLRLNYEQSQIEGDQGKEIDPATYVVPDMKTTRYETQLRLELGKPALVGGSTADGSTYLVVSVSE